MAHITTEWARDYGQADPATVADEIFSASPDVATDAAKGLNSVVLAMRFSREPLHAALATVQEGWSAAQSHDAIRTLLLTSETLEDACTALRASCAEFSSAIEKAHADVHTAYSSVDDVIASSGLARIPWDAGMDEILRIDGARSSLVWGLHAALEAIARALDDAARRLCTALTIDPSSAVPQLGTSQAQRHHDANNFRLRGDLHAATGRQRFFAQSVESALELASRSGLTAQLLVYDPNDPADQGGVAIAIGDVAAATSVSVLVPGVGNSPTEIANSIALADRVNSATESAGGRGSSAATVLWFGYDVPLSWTQDGPTANPLDFVTGALSDSVLAVDATGAGPGGAKLASFVTLLRPLMSRSSNLTLIGHSYGSTTVSQAARRLDKHAGVDDIVLLGSPGAGFQVNTAADYRAVDPDHVYSLSFPLDPVPAVGSNAVIAELNPIGKLVRHLAFGNDPGPFGANPASASFGANIISASSNVVSDSPVDLDQHALDTYLSGQSLTSVGAVAAGRYAHVAVRTPK